MANLLIMCFLYLELLVALVKLECEILYGNTLFGLLQLHTLEWIELPQQRIW